jgi:hypothetical protein
LSRAVSTAWPVRATALSSFSPAVRPSFLSQAASARLPPVIASTASQVRVREADGCIEMVMGTSTSME